MRSDSIFVSYTATSPAEQARVTELVGQLEALGLAVDFDKNVGTPRAGWRRWMSDRIQAASHVVVILNPAWIERFEGRVTSARGFGARYEGRLIGNLLYRDDESSRFILVLPAETPVTAIPAELFDCPRLEWSDDAAETVVELVRGERRTPAAPTGDWRARGTPMVATGVLAATLAPLAVGLLLDGRPERLLGLGVGLGLVAGGALLAIAGFERVVGARSSGVLRAYLMGWAGGSPAGRARLLGLTLAYLGCWALAFRMSSFAAEQRTILGLVMGLAAAAGFASAWLTRAPWWPWLRWALIAALIAATWTALPNLDEVVALWDVEPAGVLRAILLTPASPALPAPWLLSAPAAGPLCAAVGVAAMTRLPGGPRARTLLGGIVLAIAGLMAALTLSL